MNYADLVDGRQSLCHLTNEGKGLCSAQPAVPLKLIVQRFSFEEFHREEGHFAGGRFVVLKIEHPTDVWVRDLARKMNFVFEATEHPWIRGDLRAYCL